MFTTLDVGLGGARQGRLQHLGSNPDGLPERGRKEGTGTSGIGTGDLGNMYGMRISSNQYKLMYSRTMGMSKFIGVKRI
jgi:hypothetical protein